MYEKLRKEADALYTDRIGDDCFCDAISVALEFKGCLYWAFDYVDYKFFYDFDLFTSFDNADNLSEIISPNDPYYFRIRPGSVYNNDIAYYDEAMLRKNFRNMINYYEADADSFEHVLKLIYAKSKFPIMLAVNTKAFGDFYKEVGAVYPRTDCRHIIDVLGSTSDGKKCFIFDRGFDCMGRWIPTEKLKAGAIDDFVNGGSNKFAYFVFKEKEPKVLETSDIRKKFIEHMRRAIRKEVMVNGHRYMNNSPALRSFRGDLDTILEYLSDRYGKYAIPLLGEAIVLQADGSRGATRMYTEMSHHDDFEEIRENSRLLTAYTLEWQKFEKRLKYIVYGKHKYKENITYLEKTLDELIRLDEKVIGNIDDILKKYGALTCSLDEL